MEKELWHFNRQARVFNSEEEALAGLDSGRIKKEGAVAIRYKGPEGRPGMREMAFFLMVNSLRVA